MQNRRLNRLRTVLAVLFMAFTIFSVAYISLEKNHDCSGNDCAICFVMDVAEQNLKLLSFAVAIAAFARQFFNFKKQTFSFAKNTYFKSISLISQKIRLND